MARRLFLIDASSYVYRAFYAVRGLATSKGLPTNAVYGFTSMLVHVLKNLEAEAVGVVFDAPGKTFRDDLFAAYKATRQATPEDLVRQLPYVRAVPRALNLETLEVPGVEADDVLCTIARRAADAGYDVTIVTADKDFMQVVSKQADDPKPGIVLYDDTKQRRIGIDQVVEKFGVPPERVPDILALVGDTSDNIPGVTGIGPKGATELVRDHGTIETLYANLDRVKPRVRAMLEAGREDAFLSKRLATIRCDLELPFDPERFARRPPDRAKMIELFTELEFTRFLKELDVDARQTCLSREKYRAILTREEFGALVDSLKGVPRLAVDLETTSTDPMRAKIVGVSLCAREGESAYIPVGHSYLGAPAQLPLGEVLDALRPILEDPRVGKVGQNVKYDLLVLGRHGVTLAPVAFDTMVGAYLVNPDQGPFNLETLTRRCLSHDKILFQDLVGKGKAMIPFDQVPVESARDYSCEDADCAFRLTPIFEKQVRELGMTSLLEEIELPLVGVIAELERNGVRIDTSYFAALGREFEKRMSGVIQDVYRAAGEEFNIDSPRQLQRILFEKLGLDRGRRTKTGFSTDVAVLEKLAPEHELPAKILEYRGLSKLKSTYIDALPTLVNPETGRIHTSYNQAIAATGRLTSSDPNLQNIPVRTPEGRLIRKGFVPAPGRVLVGADYSQIELRLLAHLSGDPRLGEAFREGRDIHAATAREIFGAATDEARRRAKTINFGILYGMSAFGLGQRLGLEPRVAQEYIDLYFSRYAGVRAWLDRTLAQGEKDGYVRTMFGRRRYVPDLRSRNKMIRGAAERIAVNAPIQGTAADLMKIAMIRVSRRLRGTGALLILQVHDELVLEAPEGKAAEAERLVCEEMESVSRLDVPLRVDVSRGLNWAEMEESFLAPGGGDGA
jgi:DNA polymerase-1